MGSVPTEFIEVIKFRFGAPVMASDGLSGMLDHVIVDASARAVSHVGIKLSRFSAHAYTIPVELVDDSRAETVELSVTRADIIAKAQAMPAGFVRLSASTRVDAGGKHLGKLAQVSIVKSTFALRRLVVHRGAGRSEGLVPVDETTRIEAKTISVALADAQAKGLTVYRPDADLLQEVMDALYNYPRLRVDLRGMEIRAVDGEVWLRGHVSSDLNSKVAEDQLVGIPGLATVHNELIADSDLAATIAGALAADPRLREQHIGVYPMLGVVRLRGAVRTREARDVATQIAAAVPGVEQVITELTVNPDADVVPVFAGVTGQEDMVPGGA